MPDYKEILADLMHKQWSRWMRYVFKKSKANEDGSVTLPAWAVERWLRQVQTSYADLSEQEKDSDRDEAELVLEILGIK